MRCIRHWLLVSTLAVASLHAHAANTIYVNGSASGGVHDGTSWSTAFMTIQDALAGASAGDAVWVAEGIYRPIAPNGRSGLEIPAGVRLYGGFAGVETSLDQRVADDHASEIRHPLTGNPALVIPADAGADTVLDGFTITSQISVEGGSPTIGHNVFASGLSPLSGFPREESQGVLKCFSGSPIIANNIFTGASDVAIDCGNGSPTIVNNTIAGNGMGISLYGHGPSVITNNVIAFNGCGMNLANPSATSIRYNCFHENVIADVLNGSGVVGTDGNISADPSFASYDLANFHIQPDSPCRDAGTDLAVVGSHDVDLRPRIEGERVDIGSDESDGRTWTVAPEIVRVAPEGDDENDGSSWMNAKRTIQSAVDQAAVSGGEVWVKAGAYSEHAMGREQNSLILPSCVMVYGGFAGTERSLTERDTRNNVTTLDNADGYPVMVAVAGYRNSALDGFTIQVTTNRPVPEPLIRCRNGSPIVAHNTFSAPTGSGALLDGTYSSFLFRRNTVSGWSPTASLVHARFGIPTIQSNRFEHNSVSEPNALIDADASLGVAIRDNLFDENSIANRAVLIRSSLLVVQMVNNTVAHNQGTLLAFQNVMGAVYANNIFAFNTPGIQALPRYAPVRNNCFFPAESLPTVDDHGNIARDPVFVDAANGDYRLSGQSPCVDLGDSSLVLPWELDLGGGERIQGHSVDMGAYESPYVAAWPGVMDIVHALQIAGGLRAATPEDARLDTAPMNGVRLEDAVTLLRTMVSKSGDVPG